MAETQSFELLKTKRKSLRTAVTKIVNELEAELSNSDLNVDRLCELVEILCIKFEPLTLIDQQMEPLFKPEEFDGEFEIAEKYREKVLLWQFRVKKNVNEFSKPPVTLPSLQTTLSQSQDQYFQNTNNINIKVPKYHITRFYGDDASKWQLKREIGSTSTYLANQNTGEVFLQTLAVFIENGNSKQLVRAMLDTGSQKSYISEYAAKFIGLKSIGRETITHGPFGGHKMTEVHNKYLINLRSYDGKYCFIMEVNDQKNICLEISRINDSRVLQKLATNNIFISDSLANNKLCLFEKYSDEIRTLLGSDIDGKLFTGEVKQLSEGLTAVNTRLGWTVMGKLSCESKFKLESSLLVHSLFTNREKISDVWELNSLGIKDPSEKKSKLELQDLALKHFENTILRDDEAEVLNHHFKQAPEHLEKAAEKLKDSMYVDSCVASVDSSEELESFQRDSTELLALRKFDLRGCRHSDIESNFDFQDNQQKYDPQEIEVLGLMWNVKEDTLSISYRETESKEEVTKRRILSLACRIFDPIGFTCHFTLIPKLLIEECWKIETSWNSKLQIDIERKFERWENQLIEIQDIKIPQRLSKLDFKDMNLSLQVFCDASKSSYARQNFRLPIILPSNHPVVKALIIYKHVQLGHAGVQILMYTLRESYWILKGRKTIKEVIKTCIIYKRFNAKPISVSKGLLPHDRVRDAAVFEIIGLDLAGPLILKNGETN
ncbi:integrase catalytic domain-containing protein [Trichonephila clavipes]|nr:integrase catalytic domain-containing protein [Trichonephila clavipes]